MKSICVYCGSSPGKPNTYIEAARGLGEAIARRELRLVYGGGNVGLMGAIADSVLKHGGEVYGVIPESLVAKELAHEGLTELFCVQSMHERKQKMAQLADAFVALPGGIGTMEEIFEVMTWTQLGFHHKPCAFFDVDNYYEGVFQWMNQAVEERFVADKYLSFFQRFTTINELFDFLENYRCEQVEKWIDREEKL